MARRGGEAKIAAANRALAQRPIAVIGCRRHIGGMAGVRIAPPPRVRRSAVAAALLLHLVVAALLVRAFAPGFSQRVTGAADALTVTIAAPPRAQPDRPRPPEARASRPAARSGAAGAKATPRAVTAPEPQIALAVAPAPAGGVDVPAASAVGAGTGSGSGGSGPGAGGRGSGGGGLASPAVKVAGDIVAARDYPASSRAARLGHAVVIALTVGADGAVRACRIVAPSPDAEADRITCALASQRFRFRAARDRDGTPVESVFGWKQRWFRPGDGQAAAAAPQS